MSEQGQKFKRVAGRKWLWECQIGRQKVMVVVCRDLPFEEKYYRWLAFAPTTNPNWQKLISTLVMTGKDWELLKRLEQMRPQEVLRIMEKTIQQLADENKFSPELAAKLRENELFFQEQLMERLATKMKPEHFAMLIDPKVVLSKLSVQERLEDVKPQEAVNALKQKGIFSALSAEEREELIKFLTQENENSNASDK